jgi:ketosteroid isomerase-like protein
VSENLDLVRSIYATRERGDYSSNEWADEDIEYVMVDGPEPGAIRGRAALTEVMRAFLRVWQDFRDLPETFRDLDQDRVLVLHRVSGRGKTSGLDMSANAASVFHIREGRVSRIVIYWDRDRALADLGLEE